MSTTQAVKRLARVELLVVAIAFFPAAAAFAQTRYDSARVTLVENKVSIGEEKRGKTVGRKAMISDVVTAREYVLTETQSRAELEFKDHSIVRVGQNSIFSFDAGTRTFNLEKGAMLFYVPPGSGGGQVKTPSLTAAITGTIAKVSANNENGQKSILIAVIKGSLHTKYGEVPEGFAIESINGVVRIFKFDPCAAKEGKLWSFGPPLPEFPTLACKDELTLESIQKPDLNEIDIQEITQQNPQSRPMEEPPQPPIIEDGGDEIFNGSPR